MSQILIHKLRWLFRSHFWPLLMQASFYEAASSSQKLNRTITKFSLSKSLTHSVALWSKNQIYSGQFDTFVYNLGSEQYIIPIHWKIRHSGFFAIFFLSLFEFHWTFVQCFVGCPSEPSARHERVIRISIKMHFFQLQKLHSSKGKHNPRQWHQSGKFVAMIIRLNDYFSFYCKTLQFHFNE